MELDNFEYQLIARYLAGECSEQEKTQVERWLSADSNNRKKFNELQRIWDISEGSHKSLENYFDSEKEWDRLKARLAKDRQSRKVINSKASDEPRVRTSIHSIGQKIARVAAIFLIAGLVGIFAYQNWYEAEVEPEKQSQALREVSTANGQRANITMGDGTSVLLNAGSIVKFPHQFERDVREVFLEGEAFFNVTSNPEKPFIIHSRGSVVGVLGTAFSVRSYPEDGQVRVVVKEGSVSFGMESQKSSEKAILSASELGRYYIESQEIEVGKVDDMELYLSWREGYLKFRNESMHKVAVALERRYGVEVTFKDPAVKDKQLTAFLKSRSLTNVLDVVAMSLDVSYTLEENSVSFAMR